MEDLLGWLLLFVAACFAVFMAAWIVIALIARALSLLVLYWMVSFTVFVAVGLVCGVGVPLRVLRGKGRASFRQLTPQDVVAGTVFRGKARGESQHYGWDRAWPTYTPYQAREDAKGVVAECHDLTRRAWQWVFTRMSIGSLMPGGSWSGSVTGKAARAAGETARWLPRIVVAAALVPPFAGLYVGMWVSVLAWLLLMLAVDLVTVASQKLSLFLYRSSDALVRRRRRADMKCTHCYASTTLPSYHCSNDACGVIHRALLPGPLGVRNRRCECGTKLPNTIRRASTMLRPVCPVCNTEMAKGSGNRQTIQVPVIGSVGAGKTRLLAAASVQLEQRLSAVNGSLRGLTHEGQAYLQTARTLIQQHANTSKTAAVPPTGVPLLITVPGGTSVELQLMDAAGESFATWNETANLRYLDQAQALLFVLDPLPFPDIAREMRACGLAHSVLTATGEQEEAYAAAIDRMRSENVRLKDRQLGFVITKADVLLRLPVGGQLRAFGSGSVRQWLVANDFDLLVQRCEKDFARVTYFVVDSMDSRDLNSLMSPWHTLAWALATCKSPVASALAPAPEPVAAPATRE